MFITYVTGYMYLRGKELVNELIQYHHISSKHDPLKLESFTRCENGLRGQTGEFVEVVWTRDGRRH
jgi:hypothetical protein